VITERGDRGADVWIRDRSSRANVPAQSKISAKLLRLPGSQLASVVKLKLGFLDGGCVVPAAAAIGEVDRRFGHAVATSPESRAASNRELVDLGRSLSYIRVDHFGPLFDRGASLN
jgi:hypothetical protein